MILKMQYVRKHQIGLYFRKGDLHKVLEPGKHRIWPYGRKDSIEIFNTLDILFQHRLLEELLNDERIRELIRVVDLSDEQRALVWKKGRLAWMLGPGQYAFWAKTPDLQIEVFDLTDDTFEHKHLKAILSHSEAGKFLEQIRVDSHEKALLFRDGDLVRTLEPGLYVFWKDSSQLRCPRVDMREVQLDVSGQEIMTADKVTLRMNLLISYKVEDPVVAATAVSDYHQALYREAQLVVRAAVGVRKLDELLADKEAVGSEVRETLKERSADFGVSISGIGVRDIILPGDMKNLLNQVTEAQKEAEANLIRRREETAAARSQSNTAKLLADNPALMKMRELEAMKEILGQSKVTFFFGSGDIQKQLRDQFFAEWQE